MANESERVDDNCRNNTALVNNTSSLRNINSDYVKACIVDEIKEKNIVKTSRPSHQQYNQHYKRRHQSENDILENKRLINTNMESNVNTELKYENERCSTKTDESSIDSKAGRDEISPSLIRSHECLKNKPGTELQLQSHLQVQEERTQNMTTSLNVGKHENLERQRSMHPTLDLSPDYKKSSCHISFSKLSCVISILTILGIAGMFSYVALINKFSLEEISPIENVASETAAFQAVMPAENNSTTIVGRFILKSPYIEHDEFVWHAVNNLDLNFQISGPCLVVPETGTYAVFSLITFKFFPENNVSTVGHYLSLINAQEHERTFQRRIKSVPMTEVRHNPEYLSSSFVSFVGMNAGGKICVRVSEYEYVYKSSLDNVINIFKM